MGQPAQGAAGGQAALAPFDPWGVDLQDPYRVLRELREQQPVFFSAELGAWCVTRHEDVAALVRDAEGFSSAQTFPRPQGLPAAAEHAVRRVWDDAPMVTFLDPPAHGRVRSVLTRGFTPRAVTAYEPVVESVVAGVLDQLAGRAEFDLVADYAMQIPIRAILAVMDIPVQDHPAVMGWVQQGFTLFVGYRGAADSELVACARGQDEYTEYVARLIAARRARPGQDLVSAIIGRSDDGQCLTDDEIATQIMTMIGAGFETTANAIANTANALLRLPAAWPAFAAGRLELPAVVREGLRLDSPILGLFRVAKADTAVGAVRIPAGDMVLLLIASANHDESVYGDPARFQPERRHPPASLSFGAGPHYCIGAPLALLELRVALTALARAYPGLRLATPDPPGYRPMSQFRGIDRLPVLA